MVMLLVGFVLGALIAGVAVTVIERRRTVQLEADSAYLRARLRTLIRLIEAGTIQPQSVEAGHVLNDITDIFAHPDREPDDLIIVETEPPRSEPVEGEGPQSAGDEDEELRPFFPRR